MVTKIETADTKDYKRLAAARYIETQTGQNPIWSLKPGGSSYGVDKMEIPTQYHDLLELCRFFYEHDGLAYNVINKQVEIGINGYGINPKTCTDNELIVYEYLDELIREFLQRASLEYLISGLVIPEVTWGEVPGTDIDPKLRKIYNLPVDIWYRDPKSVELRKTPLPNHLLALVKISDDDKFFIQNRGKYPDGFVDRETYEILRREYPDFVRRVNEDEQYFKLESPLIIRRAPKSGSVWPTPYLKPALELFLHKRNLRKMDYAIASRVISAIQLFRMGSDEFPLLESDEDVIEDIKNQMQWRGIQGNMERVFQLFSNHTLQIDWITPDVEALLNDEKYRSINEDILSALGIPRIVIQGETLRSSTSNAELAMLPPTNTIEFMRNQLLEFPRKLYQEIKERNGFSGVPEPSYPPIRLQSLADLMQIGQSLYEMGVISRTDLAEMGNFDFDTVMERMEREREKMQEKGLLEHPEVPFSPRPGRVGDEPPTQEDDNEEV